MTLGTAPWASCSLTPETSTVVRQQAQRTLFQRKTCCRFEIDQLLKVKFILLVPTPSCGPFHVLLPVIRQGASQGHSSAQLPERANHYGVSPYLHLSAHCRVGCLVGDILSDALHLACVCSRFPECIAVIMHLHAHLTHGPARTDLHAWTCVHQ